MWKMPMIELLTKVFNTLHGELPQVAVFNTAGDEGHGDVALDSERDAG
jgi:hypothetical protein